MFDIEKLLYNPKNSSVFIIAELGINHDGKFEIAKEMIDQAINAGADAVKFQIYDINGFYHKELCPEAYRLFKDFCIPLQDFVKLRDYAYSKGIHAFASLFDTKTLRTFIQEKIFPIKIASGDALTEPWLDILLEQQAPFLVSCGSLEHQENIQLAQKIKNNPAALLYCVSEYPAAPEGFDLGYIKTLQQMLPDQAIGFSDHSQGIALSLGAVAQGAKIIERHFTLFPERADFDHPVSLSPEQFQELVTNIRIIEKALGSGQRKVTSTEKKIRPLAGRDIFAQCTIPANTKITRDHLIVLRPGNGVSSSFLESLLGKTYPQDIPKGTRLRDVFSL